MDETDGKRQESLKKRHGLPQWVPALFLAASTAKPCTVSKIHFYCALGDIVLSDKRHKIINGLQ
jgi:hypothetical protein